MHTPHVSDTDAGELYVSVIDLFEKVYGPHSPQLNSVETMQRQAYEGKTYKFDSYESSRMQVFAQRLYGGLHALKSDIKAGLIVSIQSEAQGEVLGGFLALAREALNAGQKDIAAVLACAALEDTLKRYGTEQGLDVNDKDMSKVVNTLKSKGFIRGPQGTVLRGYVQIRNKVFHAQWDAIDAADVNSIIGFTEVFLSQQFSSPITASTEADPPADAQE